MCDRCEELEEEVRQLKDKLNGKGWQPPYEFRLTPQEAEFLQCLVAYPGPRSAEILFDAINHGNADDVNRLVNVIACKVRRKVAPYGVEIVTMYGRGYRLSPESRQRLLNWTPTPAAVIAA